jgi:hypothetical protein
MNPRPTSHRDAAKPADHQPFNSLDIALLTVDQTIRGMGYPGFETQMLIWLAGRIDVAEFRRAIERLARRHPAITSRLVECDSRGGFAPRWQFQPDLAPRLNEIDLPTADAQAVFDCAADLLSVPRVPSRDPPLSFHLLHRAGTGDVLLLQYDHALMDNASVPLLVRELDRPGSETGDEDSPQAEPRHRAARRLHSLSHSQRRTATLAAIQLQAHTLRGRAAILGTGEEDKPRNVKLRIAVRAIEPAVTRAIHARSIGLCGLPSVSMSILASTFRAIRRHSPQSRNADRNYVAGVGLDLGLRRDGQTHVQNLGTIVPIMARPQELTDRDQLVRSLSRQMRDRLESRIDLGMLRLAHVFQRRPRHIRWVTDHMLRWSYSLWYAYFGSLDAIGTVGNVAVERIQFVGPVWSPIGISLLANQYRGQLWLQLTFDPDLVTPPLATAFLDTLCSDLAEFAREND